MVKTSFSDANIYNIFSGVLLLPGHTVVFSCLQKILWTSKSYPRVLNVFMRSYRISGSSLSKHYMDPGPGRKEKYIHYLNHIKPSNIHVCYRLGHKEREDECRLHNPRFSYYMVRLILSAKLKMYFNLSKAVVYI